MEHQTMPTARVYNDHLKTLLDDNSLIIDAWFDNPDNPRCLHIQHRKTFCLHKCKISIPLASLKLIFHPAEYQTKKPVI